MIFLNLIVFAYLMYCIITVSKDVSYLYKHFEIEYPTKKNKKK